MGSHSLTFRHALPADVPDEKVYKILEYGRELLRRMSGGAEDIQFRHMIDEREDKIGGPLGQVVKVCYIQLFAKFTQTDFLLPGETQALLAQYRREEHSRALAEAVAEAHAAKRKELEKAAKALVALQPDPVRDFPDLVETVPAAGVPLDKMLISPEEELRLAQTPAGVSVFDGPMLPSSPDEVQ